MPGPYNGMGGAPAANNGEDDDLAELRARLNKLWSHYNYLFS